jgi:hypothetical protein
MSNIRSRLDRIELLLMELEDRTRARPQVIQIYGGLPTGPLQVQVGARRWTAAPDMNRALVTAFATIEAEDEGEALVIVGGLPPLA